MDRRHFLKTVGLTSFGAIAVPITLIPGTTILPKSPIVDPDIHSFPLPVRLIFEDGTIGQETMTLFELMNNEVLRDNLIGGVAVLRNINEILWTDCHEGIVVGWEISKNKKVMFRGTAAPRSVGPTDTVHIESQELNIIFT